jgi:hypothetical protein
MKKLLILTILLSTSLSTFALEFSDNFLNVELVQKLANTIYSKHTPVFVDRLYFDSIGDNRLENLYLVQIPRHYHHKIRIKSSKDLIIYRAISDNNNNLHYDDNNWDLSDIRINIEGQSTSHTKVIKKLFPANNLIDLIPGGPIASDPIFIMVKDYVTPSLQFKILN